MTDSIETKHVNWQSWILRERYLRFMGRQERPDQEGDIRYWYAFWENSEPDVADLLIAGEGPDGYRLRALAAEVATGRVRFLGWVSGTEKKAQLYSLAECLLLPSRSEGFPTVVGEALCCGTPVLASRVGGVSELVTDGETGWCFPPDDVDAFRAHLAHVLNHRTTVAAMRPQARSAAERRLAPIVVAEALRECFWLGGAEA